jgi:imidazolonepropionase-like amidohydrolase
MRTVLVLSLAALATMTAASRAADMVIRNVMIASPEREAAYGPVSVAVTGGRIAEIGEKVEPGLRVIDGTGRYLSPGLIDAHTHLRGVAGVLGGVPGMRPDHEAAHPEIAKAALAQIPRSYLFHGFTTVIDLVADPDSIKAWNDLPQRPQAHFCLAAPIRDGYPTNFAPAPARYKAVPTYLIEGEAQEALPDGSAASAHTPEALAERIKASGAICVKTFYESGFGGTRKLPVPSLALIKRLSAAAHSRGLKVMLHSNSLAAHEFGAEAGIDVLAHGLWNAQGDAENLPAAISDLIGRQVKADIALQPTIQVIWGEAELFDPHFLERPALAHIVPKTLLAWYATPEGKWYRDGMLKEPHWQEAVAKNQWEPANAAHVKRVRSALKAHARRGGRLSFGSDTPSGPIYANPPGLNGRWEMDRWIEAGITPVQVFRAATQDNAGIFGLKEIGTVEVGKSADLLLLHGDPFESVSAFDAIDFVIARGHPIKRGELSATR